MNGLIIKSTAIGLPIFALLACSSENLQSTGLDPAGTGAPAQQGGNMTTTGQMPGQMMTPGMNDPAPSTGNGDSNPGNSEVNNPGMIVPSMDDDPPPAGTDGDDMGMMGNAMGGSGAGTDPDDGMMDPPDPVEPPPLTPSEIGGQLEGFMHLAPCESQDFGHDCTLPLCQGGSKTITRAIQLGGDPDTIYDITIHVYGVVEPRVYQGGVRRAGNNFDVNGSDFWYEGGVVPANPGTYNSYEFHVTPPVPGEPNDYYLNSRTGGDTPLLIRLNYEATFAAQGGGVINFRSFDLNCRQITNCNTNECGPLTPKPVTNAAVAQADPPPPATFTQPYQTGANIGRGQWFYIDVVNAVPRQ